MNNALLTLENIGYAYEDAPFALRDVNLSIGAEERIAVLGANGAGKSTFFLICNGILEPTEGHLLYEGNRVAYKKKDLLRLRERVGIVFQDPNQQLIGSTVEAEVSFGLMNLRLPREEVIRRVDAALESMTLAAMRDRPPHYLSGGERKRVTIADVLVMEPRIILFDEPTASLDYYNTAALEGLLEQLSGRGHTLIVSTHDVDFAWRWADRALVFGGGRLLADDRPETVFADRALLQQAKLPVPTLCQVAEILALDVRPKTVEELCTAMAKKE